jgi:hypothetical protein
MEKPNWIGHIATGHGAIRVKRQIEIRALPRRLHHVSAVCFRERFFHRNSSGVTRGAGGYVNFNGRWHNAKPRSDSKCGEFISSAITFFKRKVSPFCRGDAFTAQIRASTTDADDANGCMQPPSIARPSAMRRLLLSMDRLTVPDLVITQELIATY